jgi:TolB-like protein
VLDPAAASEAAALARAAKGSRRRAAFVAMAIGALLVAGFGAWIIQLRTVPPAAVAMNADPVDPNVPPLSIAVLAFENLSGDPEQQYVADGIAQDLTTDLSYLSGAVVIARESAFSYRGKQIDIREIGRQLGVRYLLEGSVRKMATSVRINTQLIAAASGAPVWADRFDKPIASLGDGQYDIVRQIGSALDVQLVDMERSRRAKASDNPASVDLILRARAILNRSFTDTSFAIATGLYEQALLLDANSVPAMTGVASMLIRGYVGVRFLKRAADLIARAESNAQVSPDVLSAIFLFVRMTGRFPESIDVFRRLLDVASGAAGIAAQANICALCWGPPEDGIPLLERTIQLNPRSPTIGVLYSALGRMLLLVGRYSEGQIWLKRTLRIARA